MERKPPGRGVQEGLRGSESSTRPLGVWREKWVEFGWVVRHQEDSSQNRTEPEGKYGAGKKGPDVGLSDDCGGHGEQTFSRLTRHLSRWSECKDLDKEYLGAGSNFRRGKTWRIVSSQPPVESRPSASAHWLTDRLKSNFIVYMRLLYFVAKKKINKNVWQDGLKAVKLADRADEQRPLSQGNVSARRRFQAGICFKNHGAQSAAL